jgi:hypothetical protein
MAGAPEGRIAAYKQLAAFSHSFLIKTFPRALDFAAFEHRTWQAASELRAACGLLQPAR